MSSKILRLNVRKNCSRQNMPCVQPHSGASANIAVYFALLKPGDTVLGLNLAHGGHLTHGSPVNISRYMLCNFIPYSLDDTERINYDKVRELALEHKPKMIVACALRHIQEKSALINLLRLHMKSVLISLSIWLISLVWLQLACIRTLFCTLMLLPPPHTRHCAGRRGGLILCKESLAKQINKAVFPGTQGLALWSTSSLQKQYALVKH